jgi:hypothetical protein
MAAVQLGALACAGSETPERAKSEVELPLPPESRPAEAAAAAPGAHAVRNEPAAADAARLEDAVARPPVAKPPATKTKKGLAKGSGAKPQRAKQSGARKRKPALLTGLDQLPTLPTPVARAAPATDTPARASAGPTLNATSIQRTVRQYGPAVHKSCWQRQLDARAVGAPASAKVTAQITVAPSGRVQSVTAGGAPPGYPGLERCIEAAVRGWTFPRARGETVTNVPFLFVAQ